jgi:addiction module RelB/DinJ family antitoxin
MTTKDATICVRVDKELKESVQRDLDALSLDMSTLITMTLKAVEREHTIPFKVELGPTLELKQAIADVESGKTVGPMGFDDYLRKVDSYEN